MGIVLCSLDCFFLVSNLDDSTTSFWSNGGIFLSWVIGGNFGGENLGDFSGDRFNRINHWRHGFILLLFIMLIIKLIKCNIVDNVGMSVAILFLSKNFGAEGTYFVVSSSVPFHFQVSPHVQVFVLGFPNTAICLGKHCRRIESHFNRPFEV